MSQVVENLIETQKFAMSIRPKIGGFPHLAEALRQAGITKNIWSLPACQSIYITKLGEVVQQGAPLVTGAHEIKKFDQEALIKALRADQNGLGTFAEFLQSAWIAGVVSYTVDFEERHVIYYGARGDSYIESYPQVDIEQRG